MNRPSLLLIGILILGFAPFVQALSVVPVYSPYVQSHKGHQETIRKYLKEKQLAPLFFPKYNEFKSYILESKTKFYIGILQEDSSKINMEFKGPLLGEIEMHAYSISDLSSKPLTSLKIGAVKIGEPEEQKNIFQKSLKNNIKILRTVPKEEDLIPLLVLGSVDVIFVDSRSVNEIKKRFMGDLKQLPWRFQIRGESFFELQK